MNILVLDKFNQRRDPAQMDMYRAMECKYSVAYCSPESVRDMLPLADVLYLGIYHQVLPVDYKHLFSEVRCPVLIDQADNEDFIRRLPQMGYNNIRPKKVFLSRYLPHEELQKVVSPLKQLSWYINPNRVKYNGEEKDIDVAFVCSLYRRRSEYAETIRQICSKNGWKCFVGQAFWDEYIEILNHTKVFIAECGRHCYTQKYTEAILCGCTIVGDIPRYPQNYIRMYEAHFPDIEAKIKDALEFPMVATPEFADRDYFLQEFNSILESI